MATISTTGLGLRWRRLYGAGADQRETDSDQPVSTRHAGLGSNAYLTDKFAEIIKAMGAREIEKQYRKPPYDVTKY